MASTRTEEAEAPSPAAGAELILRGLPVAPGIAIGPAHIVEQGFVGVAEYVVLPDQIEPELARLADAVAKSRRQLARLKAKSRTLPGAAAEEMGYLLDAHLAMLGPSRLIRGAERRIAEERMNAALAVQTEVADIARQFEAMTDAYLASRGQDIRHAGARLIRNLADEELPAFTGVPEGSVIIAEEVTPADTALMDPRRIAGFAAALGGAEGHTAIMARSLGLPAVLGIPGLVGYVRAGRTVIVDGSAGLVIVEPTPATLAEVTERKAAEAARRERLMGLVGLPSVSRDGVAIALMANVELPVEAEAAVAVGAEGVGLLRSEFLFMNRDDLPGEDEQYEALADVVLLMDGRPVTIRTLDVGGEKLSSALGAHFAEQPNPALGLRAIRLSLREPRLLETQLAAILRAGRHGPVRILLPMITGLAEVRQVRRVLDRTVRRLARRRVRIADPLPPLGVMIEVPGAALIADALARETDFFALGTNDLVQYTLAIDRGDEQVAGLFDPLHPAVLRLVRLAAEAAAAARIPVSVCGEMAGDPRMTALLVGLGLAELSMSPANLLAVKRRVRSLDAAAAVRRAEAILEESDSGRIAALLDDLNDAG
jgi:phosphotransferase system enzyme I (PtsI)